MKALLITALVALPALASPCDHPYLLERGNEIDSNCATTARIDRMHARHADFFWFERDGRSYLVTDRATLDRIDALFEPQREVGRQQSEVGRKQSAIGRRQSEVGREQSRVGHEQSRAAMDGDSAEQRELARQQEELSRRQRELSDQQRPLADEQHALSLKQAQLAREAERKMIPIEDELIRNGLAHRE